MRRFCITAFFMLVGNHAAFSVLAAEGRLAEPQARAMFQRLGEIRYPVSSSDARRILGDPSWTQHASFYYIQAFAGSLPLDSWDGELFCIRLTPHHDRHPGYTMWLRTTHDLHRESDLRSFFAGRASAATRIFEVVLFSPDATVQHFPGGRKFKVD
jgi:hypothetical protein